MTAVEWLISKIERNENPSLTQKEVIEYIEKAKEMEKKDICHFGAKCCIKVTEKKSWTIEELYNETFK